MIVNDAAASAPAAHVLATVIPHNFPFSPTSCCALAAFVWAAYDHGLTLQDEIVLVWRQKFRLAAFLFVFVRYLGLLLLGVIMVIFLSFGAPGYTGDGQAGLLYIFSPLSQFAVFWTIEIILQTRIHALYGSRRLAILNGVLFAVEIGLMLVLWFFHPAVKCTTIVSGWDYSYKDCAESVPFYWLPGIVFELWLAGLAVAKLKVRGWNTGILNVIVQDSVVYFALIAAVMVVHFALAFYRLDGFALSFVIAGQTIGGSRLVLHLRKAYYERQETGSQVSAGASVVLGSGETPLVAPPRRGFTQTLIDDSFYGPRVLTSDNRIALVPI